jgi:proline dehydrogenase
VVLGTHDGRIVAEAGSLARELGLGPGHWEVAMLYGVRAGEQERLMRDGFPLRVLISYGTAWFPWYMRRLAERPANEWFVLKQLPG